MNVGPLVALVVALAWPMGHEVFKVDPAIAAKLKGILR